MKTMLLTIKREDVELEVEVPETQAEAESLGLEKVPEIVDGETDEYDDLFTETDDFWDEMLNGWTVIKAEKI